MFQSRNNNMYTPRLVGPAKWIQRWAPVQRNPAFSMLPAADRFPSVDIWLAACGLAA